MGFSMRRVRNLVRPVHWALAAALPPVPKRHYMHWAGTGRWGDFTNPKTFNEKVNWRILHDRRPQIAEACDKASMKERARRAVPDESVLRIPETIWMGTNPDEAPVRTSRRWILKPNHSSGEVLPSDRADAEALRRTREWLVSKPAVQLGEWGYRVARPLLLMEELIPFAGEEPPRDYKFFVFDGVPRLVQVNADRFSDQPRESFFDPKGRVVPLRDARLPVPIRGADPLPGNWAQMVDLAARLGSGWDFIRIDLYSVAGEVWFGEYSPYPGGGVTRYRPASWDRTMGDWWTLPSDVGADVARSSRGA